MQALRAALLSVRNQPSSRKGVSRVLQELSNRQIRLFVSSTFRDMQAERNFLARHCFPLARQRFARCGFGFAEVDLRWGLPPEDSEERIIDLCLQEVARCQGFFVGILGHRYGFIPAKTLISDQYEIPSNSRDISITELEIIQGAFAAQQPKFIRFYFRQDELIEDHPRLSTLKAEIIARGFSVKKYEMPEQLGIALLRDLEEFAESLLTRIRGDLATTDIVARFLENQCRALSPRLKLFQDLDNFITSDSRAMCITGPTGCGKTTLLAQWVASRRDSDFRLRANPLNNFLDKIGLAIFRQHKPILWLHYSASASTSTGRLSQLLSTLINELHVNSNTILSSTTSLKETLREFHQLLNTQSKVYGLIILIIDGIDDLNLDPVLPFHWLPQGLPNLKIILSGRNGGVETFLQPEGWGRLSVTDLTVQERSNALEHYLQEFGKNIPGTLLNRIASCEAVAQPLFLRMLADELRLAETPDHMMALSSTMLQARTTKQLFGFILDRLESEHGYPLVSSIIGLLAVSRGGLEEGEIRAIIGTQKAVSGVEWSSLMCRFGRSVVDRDGRYGLFYDELYDIAQHRYLKDANTEATVRSRLIDWFLSELASSAIPSQRVIEELPWQLVRAEEWDMLESLLTTPAFFQACWQRDPNQTIDYWRAVESALSIKASSACQKMAATIGSNPSQLIDLGLLLAELGHVDSAIDLASSMRQHPWDQVTAPALMNNLLNLACFLQEANRVDDAGVILAELRARLSEHPACLHASTLYGALGNCELAKGNSSAAIEYYREAEKLHCEHNDEYGQYINRHNQAKALLHKEELTEAIRLFNDCSSYFRAIHAIEALIDTLLGLATAKEKVGKLKAALDICLEAEQLARQRNDPLYLSRSLNVKARLLEVQDDRDGAEESQLERTILCKHYGDKEGHIDALIARATIRMNVGPVGNNSALRLLSEAGLLATGERFVQQRNRITALTNRLKG